MQYVNNKQMLFKYNILILMKNYHNGEDSYMTQEEKTELISLWG